MGVKTRTPFLTGFSTLLCGRSKASMQEVLWEKRRKLLEGGVDLQQQVRDEIDPSILDRFSTTQRVRSYPDPLVFWAFLFQVSHDDSSCAHAVSQVQQWAAQQGLPVPSASTASYCEARGALPEEMLRAVHRSLCGQLDANLPESSRWRGLRPLVEDGTSAQMPDTEANRASWPCPPAQNEGCGLPVIKLDGLIDLSHGGLRDFAHCDLNTSGLCAHQKLQGEYIKERDVLIADRLYSGYEIIAGLRQRGAHFIGRTHQSRKIDFRKGRRIGPDERIVVWNKPRYAPKGSRLDAAGWEALPASLEVRLIRCQGPDRQGKVRVRYVVTTLLDHETYPPEEVASLYLHRWEIEVRFRDIKTTLGMELLRTKSPELILGSAHAHDLLQPDPPADAKGRGRPWSQSSAPELPWNPAGATSLPGGVCRPRQGSHPARVPNGNHVGENRGAQRGRTPGPQGASTRQTKAQMHPMDAKAQTRLLRAFPDRRLSTENPRRSGLTECHSR